MPKFDWFHLQNQKASRTQFCWYFFVSVILRETSKFTQVIWIQVGDPTVVKIRVSWNCHLLSASDDASSYVLCFDALLVQGRSSNEMKPTLTSEVSCSSKSGFSDNGNPRGSSMFWGPTARPVAPSSYQKCSLALCMGYMQTFKYKGMFIKATYN
jgi:hypothetical protein